MMHKGLRIKPVNIGSTQYYRVQWCDHHSLKNFQGDKAYVDKVWVSNEILILRTSQYCICIIQE